MRSFKHWNLKYIFNRLKLFIYQKTNKETPWLTFQANTILDSLLKKTDVGLEFGSGRSTIWFAKRVKHLTSVENDKVWKKIVDEKIINENLNNVDYKYCPKDKRNSEGNDSEYVKVCHVFDDGSLDFCLVDGKYREFCTKNIINKIVSGGFLIIDDVHRYLPSDSISPGAFVDFTKPVNKTWVDVWSIISTWRRIWTSDGVGDTAIFIKP